MDIDSSRAPSNFILIESYRLAMEKWLQAIFQRQHLLPFLQREVIREIFHLPNGIAYSSEYLESAPVDTVNASPQRDEDTQSVRSKQSTTKTSSREKPTLKKRASILDRIKNTFNQKESRSPLTRAMDAKSMRPPLAPKENKFVQMVEDESRYEDELMSQQPLVKIAVNRRLEGKNDKIEYEIVLSSEPLPELGISLPLALREPYVIFRRYNDFKLLNKVLEENGVVSAEVYAKEHNHFLAIQSAESINDDSMESISTRKYVTHREKIIVLLSRFPLPPSKCSLGISLNESDLSYRARRLDQWFRELIVAYTDMNNAARDVIRRFLGFDMSRELDISLQDRLALGLIEASRAEIAAPSLTLLTASSDTSTFTASNATTAANDKDLETMSQFSKNSHHTVASNVTLTFKMKDEEILAMQNKILFDTANRTGDGSSADSIDRGIPALLVYIVINAHASSKSPYLEPVKKKAAKEYDDYFDDETGSLWKPLMLRLSIPSYTADDIFIDLAAAGAIAPKRPTLAKRMTLQMGDLLKGSKPGLSTTINKAEVGATGSNDPYQSPKAAHSHQSEGSSQGKTSDDGASVMTTGTKKATGGKSIMRIGMAENDDENSNEPIEIGMTSAPKRMMSKRRSSLFGGR
jgi:hypothetical protein